MSFNDKNFLNMAIELACQNVQSGQGGPFGALIVKNDKVIATGTNLVCQTHDPTAHAEICAVRNACSALLNFQLNDCVIYSSCEPCPMCLSAIYWARLSRVVFAATRQDAANAGFDDAMIYDELALPAAQRAIVFSKLSVTDGLKPFILWNSSDDKVMY
jgi:guanine deaminase